ncbi:MAG: hypothetical protein JJE16_11355 [Nitrospiraceae bacterium]|nr:hypothetical protein [Nitrospiraceae bacterium]
MLVCLPDVRLEAERQTPVCLIKARLHRARERRVREVIARFRRQRLLDVFRAGFVRRVHALCGTWSKRGELYRLM